MNPLLWMILPPTCLIVAGIGYAAASARREPVACGKTLKEELRLIVGGAALALVLTCAWQQGHRSGELLGIMVGAGLARILGEELGNAALRRRQQAAAGCAAPGTGGPGAP